MNKLCIAGDVVQVGSSCFALKTDDIPGVHKSETFVVKYRENKYRVGEIKMGMTLCVFGVQTERPNVIDETNVVFIENHR